MERRVQSRRPCQNLPMNTVPLLIIFSSIVLIALIWAALRLTIKRDRATIQADMDEPHEIEAYENRWREEQ